MDDLYMMGDDPSVYLSPADDIAALAPPSHLLDDDDDDDYSDEVDTRRRRINISTSSHGGESLTNSTNQQQMLDVVSNKKNQRKGNRRQNNNRNRNSNTQRDSTSSFDENNPINVISAFNRTGKIYNKLRKNDAVKVIDTPSGRAGFVYQSGSTSSGSSSSNNNQQMSPSKDKSWDDSFSQSSSFANRNANDVKLVPSDENSNKKILPVLTADGKIALVVRGDTSRPVFDESQNNGSGNSVSSKKYEPITNLTSIITALNSNTDNNNNLKVNDSIKLNTEGNSELKAIQEQNRLINRLDEFFASVTNKIKQVEEDIEHKLGMDTEEADDNGDGTLEGFDEMTTTTTTTVEPFFDVDEENRKDLLLINRPLSEVLGLPKKTHYHHPHDPFNPLPDMPQTTKLHPEGSSSGSGRRINTVHRTSTTLETLPPTTSTDSSQAEEFDLESPEKINIAVIPRFDSELEERLFGKKINRDMSNEIPHDKSGAISSIHSAMQVMVAVACACTVLGVLFSYYRIPLANQCRGIYW